MSATEHKTLAHALAAFQGEAPTLYKDSEVKGSYNYKYVDLAAVVEAIKPLMLEHGLSFSAFPCVGPDGKPALRYTLRHSAGDVESDVMPLMLSKADAQALGSAITYGRRYALCAVLNLVADADDDGAAAKAAADRARASDNGNGSEPAPLLPDASVQIVLEAISRAKMGAEWVRSQLVAVGLENVPDGTLTKGTIQHLTPDQAIAMVKVCDEAAEAQVATT